MNTPPDAAHDGQHSTVVLPWSRLGAQGHPNGWGYGAGSEDVREY